MDEPEKVDASHQTFTKDWQPDGFYMERAQQGADDYAHNARFDTVTPTVEDMAAERTASDVTFDKLTAPADQTVGINEIYGC